MHSELAARMPSSCPTRCAPRITGANRRNRSRMCKGHTPTRRHGLPIACLRRSGACRRGAEKGGDPVHVTAGNCVSERCNLRRPHRRADLYAPPQCETGADRGISARDRRSGSRLGAGGLDRRARLSGGQEHHHPHPAERTRRSGAMDAVPRFCGRHRRNRQPAVARTVGRANQPPPDVRSGGLLEA